jgi:hypothetical protein
MFVHWGDGGSFLRLSRCNEDKILCLLYKAKERFHYDLYP